MGFLVGALGNVWAKIIAIGGVVLAVIGALAKVYGAGKTAERAKAQEKQLENVATRNSIDASVDSHSDDAVRKRLRDEWTHG